MNSSLLFDRFPGINPCRKRNSVTLSVLFYNKKKYAQCLKFVERCIKTDTNYWWYYLIYGFCLRELGKPTAALKQFELGWNIDPSNDEMRVVYANQLFMLQHFEKSAKIHRAFFDDKYKLKISDSCFASNFVYKATICVQFGESFINKILAYKAKPRSKSGYKQKKKPLLISDIARLAPKAMSQKRRVRYSQIAKTVLTQASKCIRANNYAFDFCYVTRRLVSVDMIDMKWKDALRKYLQITQFGHEKIPQDYYYYLIPIILRKYKMAEQILLQWIKEPNIVKLLNVPGEYIQIYDNGKLLTIYCHLVLLYCDSGKINKCRHYIESGKALCLKLRHSQSVKEHYNQSAVFYFHWVYAYYLSMDKNVDSEVTSDAVFIAFMQIDIGYATELLFKMCFYFGKYFHYTQRNFHCAKMFYYVSICRMKFNEKEMVYYNYAKLLYEMKKYKTSLKYWQKAKNLLFCRGNEMEYTQFKNLIISKQIYYTYSIYCSWCKTKQKSTKAIIYKKCARCKSVFYCSKLCQKNHWNKVHRLECKEAMTGKQYLEQWMKAKLDRICICKPLRNLYLKHNKWMIQRTEFNIFASLQLTGHGLFGTNLRNTHICDMFLGHI